MRDPMPNLPWRSSLPFRLALVLGGAIALFWLLSASAVLYLDFKETREALAHKVEAMTRNVGEQQSAELRSAARDVMTLFNSWRTLDDKTQRGDKNYLVTHYVLLDETRSDPPAQVRRAMDFVESYGSSGVGKFVDTFVVLDSGIVISSANSSRRETARHLEDLYKLRDLPPRAGLVWGRPYQGLDGGWQVAIAARDPATGAMVGVTVHLSLRFALEWLSKTDDGALIWLGDDGWPFAPLPAIAPTGLIEQLPACKKPFIQSMQGVSIICVNVEPTGWRLIEIYPTERITQRALAELPKHLPVALLSLLGLVVLLYVVLQRSLGRMLSNIVHIISPQEAVSKQQRLPEERQDELGQIAHAYNRLLDAVQAQYAELEAKVEERTAELNEARCRAERANAHKSEQLTNISHEIRTPLNGIVGALRLLGRTECDANQHDLVDTALKCSGHLLEIINNLLDFSRIESGQMVVTPSVQDPLVLIDQAMLTVQLPAQDKGLALRCQVDSSFPSQFLTDGLRLRQILINLLGNAVKFTREGCVTLSAWSAEGRVCFSVRDSGPGIPPEKYAEVFIAFRQLEGFVAGSGLGLPIARSLAQLLGGDLRLIPVESGACFQLELPLGEASPGRAADCGPIAAPERLHPQLRAWGYAPHAGENPALDAPELAFLPARLRQHLEPDRTPDISLREEALPVSPWSLNVLLVDDVDTNRDIVGRMVRQQGHRVWEAASGEDALALGRAHVFDLVLMDMRMPGLSGGETVALWRDEASGMLDPDCPIVALTANAQPGERERLLGAGFDEYLTKPVSPEMLARALDFAADQQLARGMELEPNSGSEQPLLGKDPALLSRLAADLREYYRRLGLAMEARDEAECRMLLHTLKGLAGQAGLDLLREAAEHWEALLNQGDAVSPGAWEVLGRLIESELGAD